MHYIMSFIDSHMAKLRPFNWAQSEHFCVKITLPKVNWCQHVIMPCSSYSDCIAVKGNDNVSKVWCISIHWEAALSKKAFCVQWCHAHAMKIPQSIICTPCLGMLAQIHLHPSGARGVPDGILCSMSMVSWNMSGRESRNTSLPSLSTVRSMMSRE